MSHFLAPADVERFRTALGVLSGFDLQQQKADLLGELLAHRIRQTRSAGIEPYLQRLTSVATSADELRELATELTVNETYFFREPAHLAAFVEHAVPALVGHPGEASARPLRILSAGSSSGEEAYSVAMLLEKHRPDLVALGSSVVGIDLSPTVLQKARRGRYTDWSLRQTPLECRERYFRKEGSEHLLSESIVSMVRFEQRNLLDEDSAFWKPEVFDVIFCRNVFIYFSPDAVAAVVDRFRRALKPGGFLFLGSAETLRGVTDKFSLLTAPNAFFYRIDAGHPNVEATPPLRRPLEGPVEPPFNSAWIHEIDASSERLQLLASSSAPSLQVPAAPEAAPWDFEATLSLFRRECFDEALASFPAQGPWSSRARVLRAVILTNRGEVDAAERLCRALLAREELPAEAHYLIAYGREQTGDVSAAAFHDRAASELDATFAMPRFHLAALAKRGGDFHQAREHFVRAHGLLATENEERITLFAGGFTRSGLQQLCLTELHSCGGSL